MQKTLEFTGSVAIMLVGWIYFLYWADGSPLGNMIAILRGKADFGNMTIAVLATSGIFTGFFLVILAIFLSALFETYFPGSKSNSPQDPKKKI
ncbi:MAG: hypothetical protein G01um101433_392 [Parcubacteria group bacterium Gr01-1014_33]|nr:MAG: hypothetical protein G01um101433_392 [Parcubacteria group bacterium Gr01-1014_33]